MSELIDKIKALPSLPGCYIYKNISGDIIYVGKSKCLKKRVSQYFHSPNKKDDKIKKLVNDIYDFDYIITDTETDALLLECRLIKYYMPPYNSQLKRNRRYPFINIGLKQEYPGIYVSNTVETKNAISFGCFYNFTDALETIGIISSVWKTPLCNKEFYEPNNKKRACLNMHLNKCSAPCCGNISSDEYNKNITAIINFLKGNNKKPIKQVKKEMLQMSEKLEFEKAASLRNKMVLLEKLQRRTKKFNTNLKGKDFCVFLRAYHEPCFSIFYIHDGEAISRIVLEITGTPDNEIIENFAEDIILHKFTTKTFLTLPELKEKEKAAHVNLVFPHFFGNFEQMTLEGTTLAMCITNIGADKLYVDVTDLMKRKNKDKLVKRIMENYCDFFTGP